MSRITQFFIAVVLMVVLVQSSLAQNGANRTGGYGRLVLDDGNDGGTLERVYLSNSNGSLGIDANGGVTGTFPSTCALVDMASVTKGVLLPRMTTAQRDAICPGTTPEGLLVYNLTTHTLDIFGGGGWGAISGWTLDGNTLPVLGGGGTGVGQNFIGTLNAKDFVIATNVGAPGSGVGERIRVSSTGTVLINTPAGGPANTLTVQGDGQFNGMLGSTGNTTLGTNGGSVNQMGNTGGNTNLIGNAGGATVNIIGQSATLNSFGDLATTNNFGINASSNTMGGSGVSTNNINGTTNINNANGNTTNIASAAGAATNIGNAAGTNTIAGTTNVNNNVNANTQVNTGTSTGTVTIGGTGVNSGAITLQSNNTAAGDISINTVNGAGSDLVLNGIENVALAGNLLWLTGANEVRQSTSLALVEQGITWQAEATGTKIRLGARATDGVNTNALLENRVVYLGGFNLNFSQGANAFLSLSGGTNTTTLGFAGTTTNNVTGATNNITATASNNVTGLTNINNTSGNTTNIAAGAAASTNIGILGGTNTIAGTTLINNNINANTSVNTGTSTGSVTIGNTLAGPISLTSNSASAITLNVNNTANNLVLNNINQGLLATDVNFLVMTGPTNGNVRWRTLSSFIIGTNGVEVTYPGGVADAHLSPTNNSVLFTTDRFINTNANTLRITSGNPGANELITAGGNLVTINNSVAGTTNIGNLGGATNTMGTSAALNQVGNSATTNQFGNSAATNNYGVGATTNNMGTAGTSSNNLQATTNTMNATGNNNITGTTNINTTQASNTNINTFAGAGNTVIGGAAHTGTISATSNAAGSAITLDVVTMATNNLTLNNINTGSNADAAFLSLTGANSGNVRTRTINSMITGTNGVDVTYTGSSADAHLAANNATVLFANDRFINTNASVLHITSGNPGANDLINAGGTTVNINNSVAGTTNIGSLAGATNNVGTNATNNNFGVGAANNIMGTAGVSGNQMMGATNTIQSGNNTITGTTNINTTGNQNTNINTFAGGGNTTIGGATHTGTINLTSNAAGGAITLDVTTAATNNLVFNNINQDNTTVNLLSLTGVNSGNVRTHSLASLLTGSNGVEVTLSGGTLDAHFPAAAGLVPFTSDRFHNTAGFVLHFNNGGTDYATFSSASIGLNNAAANAGTTIIGNTTAGGNVTISAAAANSIAVNGTTNINTAGAATPALTTVGNASNNQHLRVNGLANAVVGNTLVGNPTVWDMVVVGDQVTTGIAKFGGSLWIDGVSATHNINTSAPLLVNTTAGDITLAPASAQTQVIGNLIASLNITSVAGNIVTQAGSITANGGNITATTGDIAANIGSISANLNITAVTGDIRANAGNIVANGGRIGAGTGVGTPGSTITSNGSLAAGTNTGGSNTLTVADFFYLVNASNQTVTLPNAAAVGVRGRIYIVKNDAGVTNTTVNGGGTNIDGAANDVIAAANSVRQYISNGANWFIISTN